MQNDYKCLWNGIELEVRTTYYRNYSEKNFLKLNTHIFNFIQFIFYAQYLKTNFLDTFKLYLLYCVISFI